MENTLTDAPEQETSILTEETSEQTAQTEPTTPQEQLTALINRRMGSFDLRIRYTDLKYIKNLMQSKVEWKGPNEAYLTIMAALTLSNSLEQMDPKSNEPVNIQLPSSTFESLNYFLNRISGAGLESAQRLFSVSMILRPTIEALKKLDDEIETLKAEIKTEKTA